MDHTHHVILTVQIKKRQERTTKLLRSKTCTQTKIPKTKININLDRQNAVHVLHACVCVFMLYYIVVRCCHFNYQIKYLDYLCVCVCVVPMNGRGIFYILAWRECLNMCWQVNWQFQVN